MQLDGRSDHVVEPEVIRDWFGPDALSAQMDLLANLSVVPLSKSMLEVPSKPTILVSTLTCQRRFRAGVGQGEI